MAKNRSPSIRMSGHVRSERPVTFKRNQRSLYAMTGLDCALNPSMQHLISKTAKRRRMLNMQQRPKIFYSEAQRAMMWIGGSEGSCYTISHDFLTVDIPRFKGFV